MPTMDYTEEEIRAAAMIPPPMLSDMTWIYQGGAADNARLRGLKNWFEETPSQFMREMIGLEKEYRKQVSLMGPPEASKEKDEGAEKADELYQRLLTEYRDGNA